MTEESDSFKLTSQTLPGTENQIIVDTGNKSACVVTTVASMGPEPQLWTTPAAPPPPPPVDEYNNYFFNSPQLGYPQNGYFFQNFGPPPPNMGMLKNDFHFTFIISS